MCTLNKKILKIKRLSSNIYEFCIMVSSLFKKHSVCKNKCAVYKYFARDNEISLTLWNSIENSTITQ